MDRQELHRQIDHIFNDLLPAAGMAKRDKQIALSHNLLDAMLDMKITLCDAGTGIGKTFAYLTAGFVFLRYRALSGMPFRPLIISTSSIALQTELHNEYIPQLAEILLSDGWEINKYALSVIRKGKSHYVCDRQLEWRLEEVSGRPHRLKELSRLQEEVDMDLAGKIRKYDQKFLHVPSVCNCGRTYCRYLDFLDDCATTPYLFQICNHNLLLADAVRKSLGYRPILPDNCSVVIDEAHKLPETARDMLSFSLDGKEIRKFILRLHREQYVLAGERLSDAAKPLLRKLDASPDKSSFQHYAAPLAALEKMLRKIQKTLGDQLSPVGKQQLDTLTSKVSFFCNADEEEKILYIAETEKRKTMLRATLPDLSQQFQDILWNPSDSVLLVSGTLALGKDFTRFREAAGLLNIWRTEEFVALSPFDYKKNCLLYFPLTPPKMQSLNYYEKLTDEIVALLNVANGHALALFTSYADLSAVKELLTRRKLPWRIYASGDNADYTVNQFRQDSGSVLLGAGPLWEGMDFPGDCVSLLIFPHLPFPYPDAVSEFERKKHKTLRAYIEESAIPEMQIKLRQGFGRAIRTETDTCVIAILDERARPGSRYYRDVVSVLPPIPKKRNLQDVEDFIRRVKPEEYFKTPLIGAREKGSIPEN